MTAKQLPYREDARDRIRRSVDTPADAEKVTRGRTMILDRGFSRRRSSTRASASPRRSRATMRYLSSGSSSEATTAVGQPLAQARLVKAKTLRSPRLSTTQRVALAQTVGSAASH